MGNRGSDSRRRRLKARLRQSESVCWLCLYPLDDEAPAFTDYATEVDEEVPAAKGGDVMGILTPCHLTHRCCNLYKSDRVLGRGSLRSWFAKEHSGRVCETHEGDDIVHRSFYL